MYTGPGFECTPPDRSRKAVTNQIVCGVSINLTNYEQQGTHTTGPLSPLFATTTMILPRWDVRAEEVGEGARELSGWKT